MPSPTSAVDGGKWSSPPVAVVPPEVEVLVAPVVLVLVLVLVLVVVVVVPSVGAGPSQ